MGWLHLGSMANLEAYEGKEPWMGQRAPGGGEKEGGQRQNHTAGLSVARQRGRGEAWPGLGHIHPPAGRMETGTY